MSLRYLTPMDRTYHQNAVIVEDSQILTCVTWIKDSQTLICISIDYTHLYKVDLTHLCDVDYTHLCDID